MVHVRMALTHPPRSIIEHTALYLIRYDDYLADYSAKLLSYVVEVDMSLGEHYNFSG